MATARNTIIKELRGKIDGLQDHKLAEELYEEIQDADLSDTDKRKVHVLLSTKVQELKQAEHDDKFEKGDKEGAEEAIKPDAVKEKEKAKKAGKKANVAPLRTAEEVERDRYGIRGPVSVPKGCMTKELTSKELGKLQEEDCELPAKERKLVGVRPVQPESKGLPISRYIAVLKKAVFVLAMIISFNGVGMANIQSDDIAVFTDFAQTAGWSIDADGNLIPVATNDVSIGTTAYYPSQICLGGSCKTAWGSIVSPMTDASGYVYPTDSGAVLRLYDAGYINLGAGTAVDQYILMDGDTDDWYAGVDDTSNDYSIGYGSTLGTDLRLAVVDDANNTTITVGDGQAGYDKVFVFDGASTADYYIGIDDTGGGEEDLLTIGTGSTVGSNTIVSIGASAGVLYLTNGLDAIGAVDIDYGSDNITDHTFVSDGGTTIIDGTITLTSSEVISNATDDTVRVASEDSASVLEVYTPGTSNEDATLLLTADADADAGDRMAIQHDGATNSMFFMSDTASADTLATILTLAKTGAITTTAALNAEIEDASNTTVTDVLNLQHFTSGTAAAGIGTGLTFDLENAAGTEEEHAYIDVVSAVATDSAEDSDLVIGIMAGGTVSEFLRIDTDNSATAGSQLVITQTTTETDAILDILSLANSTGTATDDAGLGITWDFEDAGGAEEQASLDVTLVSATNAAEMADFVFSQQSAGAVTETLRLVGTQSATAASHLQFTGTTSETNGIVDVMVLKADTSGTVANNIGAGISIEVEDAGGVEEQASLDVQITDTTTNSENADIILSANTEGTIREVYKIDTDATATDNTLHTLTSWTIETNGVRDAFEFILDNTADTATDDLGMGFSFVLEDETGNEQRASMDIVQTDAARATNDTDIVFSQDVNGTITERVRFDADGGNILLSGATPGIVIGDAGDEDSYVRSDQSGQDYVWGVDATDDEWHVGTGATLGTNILSVDSAFDATHGSGSGVEVTTLYATQYVSLLYSDSSARPASGAKAGSLISIYNADDEEDCGHDSNGTTFVVCVSDGTNWKALDFYD